MWKNKKNCRKKAVVAALLTGCLLAGAVPVSADDTAYETTTVARGTMSAEAQLQINYEYVKKVPVYFSSAYGATTFLGYVVEPGDYVGEGEPIANISTEVDEILLEEMRLRLQRAEEARDQAYAEMQKRHEEAQRAAAESTGTQKQIALLRLEQLEMEQEREKRQTEEGLLSLREQLEACEQEAGRTQILSPVSGRLITSMNYYRVGGEIANGAQVCIIECSVEPMFTAKDANGVMRYGKEMTILGPEKKRYRAKIVSCSSKYLSDGFQTTMAYFKPDPNELETWGFDAVYENVHIENILLVDTAAVQKDRDGTYVVELKDGKLTKCYFTVGKTVNNLCYAIDGLTEGMTVVIQ